MGKKDSYVKNDKNNDLHHNAVFCKTKMKNGCIIFFSNTFIFNAGKFRSFFVVI